jgi:hypothetical protein
VQENSVGEKPHHPEAASDTEKIREQEGRNQDQRRGAEPFEKGRRPTGAAEQVEAGTRKESVVEKRQQDQ